MKLLRSMRVAVRLPLVIAVGVTGMLALALVSVATVNTIKVGGERDQLITQVTQLRADIAALDATIVDADRTLLRADLDGTPHDVSEAAASYEALLAPWLAPLGTLDAGDPIAAALIDARAAAHRYFELAANSPTARSDLDAALAEHGAAIARAEQEADRTIDITTTSAIELADGRQRLMTGIVIAVLLTVVPFVMLVTRSITGPLRGLLRSLCALAHDTGAAVALDDDGHDEFGQVAKAFNAIAARLAEEHRETATAAAESAARALDVERSAAVVAQDLRLAAGASADLSSTASEIARSAADASEVADSAVAAADHANGLMVRLAEATDRIGDVVESIRTIAAQTTMLALNATIEAARAGEAGRGFAVVAGEVKQLAGETGSAATEIVSRVETIRADTDAAVAALSEVTGVIGRIDAAQATIADAVGQQAATSNEMDRRLNDAVSVLAHLEHAVPT